MSYDLRISVKVEGLDKFVTIAYPEINSPTYNLGDMFRKCMDWYYNQGEKYRCSEVIGYIEHGINELTYHSREYEVFVPANGYGDIGEALETLKSLRKCIREQAEYIPMEYMYMNW